MASATPLHWQTVRNARTPQAAQAVTDNDLAFLKPNPLISQLALPKIDFPTFKSANYHTWSHMTRIFFIQHGLYSIVNGYEPNPASPNILPTVFDGLVRLADGSTLNGDPIPTWSDAQKHVWNWNHRHTLAYGFIIKSLTDDAAAYSKVIDCKMAHDIWEALTKEYGQSSNVFLCVLELQLSVLFKKEDKSMSDHVD